MGTKIRQLLYALLAIAGLVFTWWHNLAWMAEADDVSIQGFWTLAFDNPVSASLAWDIIIAGAAGFVLVWAETVRIGMSKWWIVAYWVTANLLAAAFALPAFLLLRERHLSKQEQ